MFAASTISLKRYTYSWDYFHYSTLKNAWKQYNKKSLKDLNWKLQKFTFVFHYKLWITTQYRICQFHCFSQFVVVFFYYRSKSIKILIKYRYWSFFLETRYTYKNQFDVNKCRKNVTQFVTNIGLFEIRYRLDYVAWVQ